MFYNCASLVEAPDLPATTLDFQCYDSMFTKCTNLNYIKVGFTEWNDEYTGEWVDALPASGTFIKPVDLPEIYGKNNIPSGWTIVNYEGSEVPLTFIAKSANSTIRLTKTRITNC